MVGWGMSKPVQVTIRSGHSELKLKAGAEAQEVDSRYSARPRRHMAEQIHRQRKDHSR
jgi:hypothetical protein